MRGIGCWQVLCGALALGCRDEAVAPPPPLPRALTLLHTSDLHSRLWPFRSRVSAFEAGLGLGRAGVVEEVGGVARLATLLGRERSRGAAVWLDSGDALEGAPIFQRFGGRLELELLGSLGLGAMALGNHELSLGPDELAELLRSAAPFPVLAVNLRPGAASPLSGWLAPSTVLDVAGVRLGVVGVANPQSPPSLGQPSNAWGLDVAPELAAVVQRAVDDLAPRSQLVVVLSHLGLEGDRELVRATSGVAAVLGGHQHLLTAEPEWQDDCVESRLSAKRGCASRRVPIVHSGAYGQWLTRLTLTLAPSSVRADQLEVENAELEPQPVAAGVPEDPRVATYLEARRPEPTPPLAFLPAALARRSPLAGDSTLGNLTAEAMRSESQADVALLNSSGLREDLAAGVLLRSDLELAFPFAEPWRRARLQGRALRRGLLRAAFKSAARECESSLQVAGLRLRMRCAACDARSDDCLSVERTTLWRTTPLDDDEWLWVVLPAYLTLPGADFEDAAASDELDLAVVDALSRLIGQLPARGEPEACAAALASWSARRCREAFADASCPLSNERSRALCSALPLLKGERDGRIEMLP